MVCMLIFSSFNTDKQSLIIFSIRDIFIKIPHNLQLVVCIYYGIWCNDYELSIVKIIFLQKYGGT